MYCKNCRATIKDAADSCPQCLSPALFVNIKFLFQLFAAALSNPASILFALLTVASLELIVTRSNVSSLPLALFPFYMLLALIYFLLIFLVIYQIAKDAGGASLPNFARAYVTVHLKFLSLYMLYPYILVSSGMEGNVIGFLLLPLFILSLIIAAPLFIWKMCRHLSGTPPAGQGYTFGVTKGAWLMLMAFFCLVLFGAFNCEQAYRWRAEATGDPMQIPAVSAMQNALDAVKDRDPVKFERHVNLRGILQQMQAESGDDFDVEILRDKILAQIVDGSAMPKGDEDCAFLFQLQGIAFGWSEISENFRFNNNKYLFHPLGAVKKDELFVTTMPALCVQYSFSYEPEFEVIRCGNDYKIEKVLNLKNFYPYEKEHFAKTRKLEEHWLSGRRLSFLRIEPTETIVAEPISAGAGAVAFSTQIKFHAQIKNDSNLDFQEIQTVLLLRDRQSGRIVGIVTEWFPPVNAKNPLKAGDMCIWEEKSYRMKKHQVENLLSGRYEMVLLIPEATTVSNQKMTLDDI